jgi:hypothetical protein
MLTEVPENIKAMLNEHGGTYMGIVNELNVLLRNNEITGYAIHEAGVFIRTHGKYLHYVHIRNVPGIVPDQLICEKNYYH